MKLVYWVAECKDDSPVYNIREKTKKAAKEKLAVATGKFGEVHKVEVEYSDGFDLLTRCLGEGRIFEGETESTLATVDSAD